MAKAWGFWTSDADEPHWIGPRHTNFHDGSVCAFAPQDNVWRPGGNLITLLDLYSVWALRQLHLEIFGLWPGKQYTLLGTNEALEAHYRLSECNPLELCGCGAETLTYAECCLPKDRKWNRLQLIALFMATIPDGFGSRRPPTDVVEFVRGRRGIPAIKTIPIQMP